MSDHLGEGAASDEIRRFFPPWKERSTSWFMAALIVGVVVAIALAVGGVFTSEGRYRGDVIADRTGVTGDAAAAAFALRARALLQQWFPDAVGFGYGCDPLDDRDGYVCWIKGFAPGGKTVGCSMVDVIPVAGVPHVLLATRRPCPPGFLSGP